MDVRFLEGDPLSHDTPLLAVGVAAGSGPSRGILGRLDESTQNIVHQAFESGDIKGGKKDELLLYREGPGPRRLLLLGLGDAARIDAEATRRFLARAVRAAERHRLTRLAAWLEPVEGLEDRALAQAAAEGAALAAWRFSELKTDAGAGSAGEEEVAPIDVASLDLFGSGEAAALAEGVRVGAAIARAANLARTLQARPGNVATPTHLAEEARRVAAGAGLECEIFDAERLREEGMHAILAVSRGSEEEPCLIVLRHGGGGDGEAPLVLVGKGLTFDAGGISLKPAKGMEEMKFDMSGGAAVIGAMQAVAELGVPANVVGIVPSSENLPSGKALKPGDVIHTYAGKTVEVVNTDAEGRLILADALAYGARLGPAAMVDCATLTGSVVIALGHHAAAVFGTDDELIEELRAAGDRSGERCWPLPLWDVYRQQLDSDTADLMNVGGRPAGSITAAIFLREFAGGVPWAHLDIAGTAYGDGDLPYQRKGGYGFPSRLLIEWVRSRAG